MGPIRLSIRGIVRSPGTALASVVTLGLGLGATVTLFGVIQGMFRPLPVPQGEEIVRGEIRTVRGEMAPLSRETVDLWRDGAPGLRGGAIRTSSVTVVGLDGFVERRSAAALTSGLVDLLGVPPLLGRFPVDPQAEQDAVVLGYELWQSSFGGAESVLGLPFELDGRTHTVVGVMPEGFAFPYSQELWTVFGPGDSEGLGAVELVGRVDGGDGAFGRTEAALEGALAGVGADSERGARRVTIRPWVGGRGESGEVAALAGLSVLVTLLLILCAANVSTLLSIRGAERAGVLAVHSALGASRFRVASQLFLEALWIAIGGGVLGVFVGGWLLGWIETTLAQHWGYYWMAMELQPAVIVWTAGVVIGLAVLSGTLPALRASRTDLRSVLSGQAKGSGGGSDRLGLNLLRVQVAISTTGLIAAAFLGSGVLEGDAVMDQLPVDEVLVANLSLEDVVPDEAGAREETVRRLVSELGERWSRSGVSVGIPAFSRNAGLLEVVGGEPELDLPSVRWIAADPAIFDVYDLPVLRGRAYGSTGDDRSVVVNESFARRYLGAEVLGAQLRIQGVHGEEEVAEVVGVVRDHYPDSPDLRPDLAFVPLSAVDVSSLTISIREGGDPATASSALRSVVRQVDSRLPVQEVTTLRAFLEFLSRVPRTIGIFGAIGGLVGMFVASVGLYGIIAFRVRRRLPEIGVRMALGAQSDRILGEVVGGAVRTVLPGIGVGLLLGGVVSPLLATVLFGLSPFDPLTYVAVAALMVGVTVAAALVPALGAARLEPLTVLRSD